MARQVAKRGGRETPAAVKAKGAKIAEKMSGTELVPVIKTSAMSVEVGPKVLEQIAAFSRDERQVTELRQSIEGRKYDALASLTAALVKAAKADSSIRLEAVFSTSKVDKMRLNNQIGLALGFKSVYTVGKEGAQKQRIDWSQEVAELVKPNKDDPDSIGKQKGTVRTNFAHMLTKCCQVAVGLLDDDVTLAMDKASGTLRLTGPAVKQHFGEASVLLNEKQNQQVLDKKGKVIGEKELKAKPSYTEIARRAAENHGKTLTKRVDSRAKAVDPSKHIIDLSGMLVKALSKYEPDELPVDVAKALKSVQSAIVETLD